MVDFEDGHEYAIHGVPADLKTTSPAEMHEIAKQKPTKDNRVKKAEIGQVGLK